ncbi:MAG: cbb3-type cytochrome c oxidase subunit I [Pseudomonadota bacterium]
MGSKNVSLLEVPSTVTTTETTAQTPELNAFGVSNSAILHNVPGTAKKYIYLGIGALALSGIYSIFLVLLRAPILSNIFSNKDLFKTALVIHVNLSVLVWLLSSIVALWCISASRKYDYWICYSSYVASIGIILMAIAPLTGASAPVLNNYIPMLENWCFITGLVTFGAAILIPLFCSLVSAQNTILYYANCATSIIVLISYACFVLSYYSLQKLLFPMDLHFFYETLFWSGGHILQFAYTEGAMVMWLVLLEQSSGRRLSYSKTYIFILLLNAILSIPGLFPHAAYAIDSMEFTEFFTLHMKYCAGLAPTMLVIICFLDLVGSAPSSPWILTSNITTNPLLKRCLISSLFLFFSGGFIGLLIAGVNVTIPAHYHGSIVGVSIAFMGLSYYILSPSHLNSRQPYIYAIGQMMHITGLAVSGGYGVLRKNPDAILTPSAKITMAIMGFGGLIAVLGGLMFVWICVMSFRRLEK